MVRGRKRTVWGDGGGRFKEGDAELGLSCVRSTKNKGEKTLTIRQGGKGGPEREVGLVAHLVGRLGAT